MNLIGVFGHGKGLDTDVKILKEGLEKFGCSVSVIDINGLLLGRAHINIFIQGLYPQLFTMANQNWFIPNPEWYEADIRLLDQVDLILCRTEEVERIFKALSKPTYFLGFTSPDCYLKTVEKDYRHFLHLAGGSHLKGTKAVKKLWSSSVPLPLLTVIDLLTPLKSSNENIKQFSHYLPENDLRLLQNQCGFHLCPSETEGFGHYIMEAMSTCAVVVTTDAPPMNEFIQDKRCLVPHAKAQPLLLATRYEIDSKKLQEKIEALMKLPPEKLKQIGKNNRSFYLQKQHEFHQRLEELVMIAESLKT